MSQLLAVPFLLLGYLIGTVPTGWLVARARGVDIQRVGSGNIGATNAVSYTHLTLPTNREV